MTEIPQGTDREAELEMVRRHVAEGKQLVSQQKELVLALEAEGRDTRQAEDALEQFEGMQRLHEEHLERLVGPGRASAP